MTARLTAGPGSKAPTETRVLAAATATALGAAALAVWLPRTTKLVGFVLLTIACHGPLSPFLPAMFEPILLLYGQLHPPLLIAVVGALTSVGAECLNYHLYRTLLGCDSLDRVMRSGPARAVASVFARQPFLAVWVCAWSPLPDWAARILASHAHYPVARYLLAFLVGRIPKFWLLATIGLHWVPSGQVIFGVVAGSVLLSVVGGWTRRAAGGPGASPGDVVSIPSTSSTNAYLNATSRR